MPQIWYSMPNSIYGCVGAVPFQRQKIDVENNSLFSALFRERRFFLLLKMSMEVRLCADIKKY